jgi:predicted  nucleic acid-binding Zn-ribbon protein
MHTRASQEQGGALVNGWRQQQAALEVQKADLEVKISKIEKTFFQTQEQLRTAEKKFAEVWPIVLV